MSDFNCYQSNNLRQSLYFFSSLTVLFTHWRLGDVTCLCGVRAVTLCQRLTERSGPWTAPAHRLQAVL